MEKLKEKTMMTIFTIISIFFVIIIVFINIDSYQEEYSNIKISLNRMNNVVEPFGKMDKPNKTEELGNKIIMDYNFYTFLLDKDNNIIDKISHNENEVSPNILNRANEIINNNKSSKIDICFLYSRGISYNYKSGAYLLIVDTSSARERLFFTLNTTIIILIIFEILIFCIAKRIAFLLTKPVEDSFNKQKEFITNASHELKTPLAVMMASIDCLEENNKNRKYINNLKIESDRMNNLITRLLDLSKSEIGSGKRELYDLSKITRKRILVFESLAFENSVSIKEEIENDIMFNCNLNDIEDLLSVLIDNAIKHSYKDSEIIVKLYRSNQNIILEVINNGDEIPKCDYDKIFERFYRSDLSRERKSNRYGLGLAIAKNIVSNYNGEIKVVSENNYTTFKVILKNNKE